MPTLDELASYDEIKKEYQKALMLSVFKKLCVKMTRENDYREKLRNIYRQSYDKVLTTQLLLQRDFHYQIPPTDAVTFCHWIDCHMSKQNTRKLIPQEVKDSLKAKQDGRCLSCGEPLGDDWSKIHVDHIIPFKLVGDELPDNYQLLCDICNECKSAKTDYIFLKMLKLN